MADDERTRSNRDYLAQLDAIGAIHLRKSPYKQTATNVNRVAEGLQAQAALNLPYSVQAARGHAATEHGKAITGRTYKPAAYQSARTVSKIQGARVDSRGNIHVNGKNLSREDVRALARSAPKAHLFIETPGGGTAFKHGGISAEALDDYIIDDYGDSYDDFLDDYDSGYKRKA